jgi:guanylate cyclase soluble subunit beta
VCQVLGSNVTEFLGNLNNLHLHLSNGQPAMDAPAFRVDEVR